MTKSNFVLNRDRAKCQESPKKASPYRSGRGFKKYILNGKIGVDEQSG